MMKDTNQQPFKRRDVLRGEGGGGERTELCLRGESDDVAERRVGVAIVWHDWLRIHSMCPLIPLVAVLLYTITIITLYLEGK